MLTIYDKSGNIFNSTCDVLINPTNCQGVMGKGLAKQFKQHYDGLEQQYKQYCKLNNIKPGMLFSYVVDEHKTIICFPTKDHWRNSSKYEYIESGMDSLVKILSCNENEYKSIAIPALGCGLGELEWILVREIIVDKLNQLDDDLSVELYVPLENDCIRE